MAQAKKRSVRPTRGAAANKAAEDKPTPPAPPAGLEEVTDSTTTEAVANSADPETNGEAVDLPDPAADAQNAPESPENGAGGAKADSHEYIDAHGNITAEDDTSQNDDDDEETKGTKFKGGKRYKPKDTRVVPPKGRVIPAGGKLTFDGIDFGTHIVSTEDVFREVFQFNSRRPTYVLEIRAGAVLPRTVYEAIEEKD